MISYYYAESFRCIVLSLLERFSYMEVHRYNKERTSIIKVIPVPITFAPVEKTQQDRLEDYTVEPQSLGQRYYLQVPRLALTFNSMTYAPDRATGVNETRYFVNNTQENQPINNMFKDLQPTPYNYTFTLNIRTDSISDFSQIIENIIPYFNPKLYLRVKEFSFLNIERDLSVILNEVTPAFTDELDKHQMRQIDGTVTFTVEGWAYKPVSTSKLVKVVKTRFYSGGMDATISEMDKQINISAYAATSAGTPPDDAPIAGEYQISAYDSNLDGYFYMNSYPASQPIAVSATAQESGLRVIQPARVWQSS